jgi:hypothetical protein
MVALDDVMREMTEELIAETDGSPETWEQFDMAIEAAMNNQLFPEEIDLDGFDISMETSPPLRSKLPIKLSRVEETEMINLIEINEVMEG